MYIYIPDWLIVFLIASLIAVIFIVINNRYSSDKEGVAVIFCWVCLVIAFFLTALSGNFYPLVYMSAVLGVSVIEVAIYYYSA